MFGKGVYFAGTYSAVFVKNPFNAIMCKQAIRLILPNKTFELLSYPLTCVGSGCVLKDFDIISYSRS